MTRKAILVVALVAGAALLTLTGARFADGSSAPGGITVNGTGTVRSTPNVATWTFAAVGRGGTSKAALDASSTIMQRVLAALKAAGIAPKDLQTQQVAVTLEERKGKPAEYVARNEVTATVREIARAGAIVDAAVRAGATDVNGPTFARSDADALYRQALGLAVADAKAKAQTLATSGGLTLGRPTAINESGGPVFASDAMRGAAPQAKVPVEPGQTEVQATVTVVFAIS